MRRISLKITLNKKDEGSMEIPQIPKDVFTHSQTHTHTHTHSYWHNNKKSQQKRINFPNYFEEKRQQTEQVSLK